MFNQDEELMRIQVGGSSMIVTKTMIARLQDLFEKPQRVYKTDPFPCRFYGGQKYSLSLGAIYKFMVENEVGRELLKQYNLPTNVLDLVQ